MTQLSDEAFAAFVAETAAAFEYPPTPIPAERVTHTKRPALAYGLAPGQRPALALAFVFALVVAALLMVPPARATMFDFLQQGAIRIGLLPAGTNAAPPDVQPTSIIDLGQEVPLEQAARIIPLQPGYVAALGPPTTAYAQNLLAREPVVTYVWAKTDVRPQLALTLIALDQFGQKWAAGEQVTATTVLNQPAIWIEGPHRLDLGNGRLGERAVTATNVLLWSRDGLTLRLEGDFDLVQARRIAESSS